MSKKCKNEVLMKKIGLAKIDKNQTEFALTVLENLPDCKRINTKNYVDIKTSANASDTTKAAYNRFLIPKATLECGGEWCKNSGTLTTGLADGYAVYRVTDDATEWASGIITFYMTDLEMSNTVTVKISSDESFTNADSYSITNGVGGSTFTHDEESGYWVVAVDLSEEGETVGDGWTPSTGGAYISISTPKAMSGISSIAIFDSLEDFGVNNVVIIGCLTNMDMPIDIDAADATCFTSGYDDRSEPEIEMTLEGNSVTPNYYLLNPLDGKGEATVGFERVTVERVVQQTAGGLGIIELNDAYQEQCGFLSCALSDQCDVINGQLFRLSIPVVVKMDENQYIVKNLGDGITRIYFNGALVGQTVIVTYPKEVEVEERIDSAENLNRGVKVRAVQTVCTTDGNKIQYIYPNVLVTSFPHTINEEETSFSFTLRFRKDEKGVIRYTHRIIG